MNQTQEIRIILVGKTGVGKSATGNTILGREHFLKAASSMSVTKHCSFASTVIDGKKIMVVDTPGISGTPCDTELSEAELTQETVKCIDMLFPGPHAFLLTLAIGNRYTAEERKAVQQIQEVFGEGATRYTMILFTRGDKLEVSSFDSYLKGASKELQALLSKCNGRYHIFNNRDKSHNQVSVLLQKIQDMVQNNGGECYTNSTYQLLEKYKKREAEIQQEADATKREMQTREAELQRRIKLMEEEQERQRLREAVLQKKLRQQEIESIVEGAFMVSLLEQMQINENVRRQQGERERERVLSAQVAEHQRIIDLERKQQREDRLRHQRRMQEDEMRRKKEEYEHKRRMESERQRLEQERADIERQYRAKKFRLEEQTRQAEKC